MRHPLLFSFASLLFLSACIGCGGDAIPTTAPPVAKEPADLLYNLQYLAVRKDYQAVTAIAPITPIFVYTGAMHFHQDAKAMGLALTPEESKGLGVEHLAAKLDTLPGGPSDDYQVKDARLAFNAGIYRLTKGLTAKSWAKMKHMGITDNTAGRSYGDMTVVKDMALGFGGTKIMTVSCIKKPDGNWGISLIHYEVVLKTLKQE